jgi:hypothetical protein
MWGRAYRAQRPVADRATSAWTGRRHCFGSPTGKLRTAQITLAWTAPSFAAVKGVLHTPAQKSTMKPESRDALHTAIAKARGWVNDIWLGRIASFAEIAKREAQGERHVRLLAPLAFVSPRIIAAIVDGHRSSGSHGHRPRQSTAVFVGRAGAGHRTLTIRVFRGRGFNANVALEARCAALRTSLCHISNRSPARRNGNWKMPSRDWRRKTTGPGPKVRKLQARDSGAPA